MTARNSLTPAFYRALVAASASALVLGGSADARAQTPVVRGATEWSASARLRQNPGVNAHMLTMGWTRMGAR